jgi:hypothetical protein
MKMKPRWMILVAILATVSLIAAACGDDDDTSAGDDGSASSDDGSASSDDGGDDGSASSDDGSASSDDGSASSDDGAEPMEPIKVMTISPVDTNIAPFPNILEAAKVYGQYINDRGGVAGHPLEVITCDGKGDPNEAAVCARQAVDEGVVAVVGHFEFDMSSAVPILEEAGIAMFGGCCPVVGAEFTTPINFPFGSVYANEHAAVYIMNEDGCQNPAFVFLDIYADFMGGRAQQAIDYFGVYGDNAKFVAVPAAVGDYSAQAAEASDGTDCIYTAIGEANWGAFFAAMRSVGADQTVYGAQGNLNSVVAGEFPDLAEGGVAINSYPNLVDPVWDEYRAALDEYDAPDLDWNSLAGLGTWAAYVGFTDVVEMIDGDITAASFLETARGLSDFQTMFGPTIDLSLAEGPVPGFPRVLNLAITFDRIGANGELSPTGEFVDFTDAVQG